MNLELIYKLYPKTQHQVVGISQAIKGNQVFKADELHSEFISFRVRHQSEYWITPANGHDNMYSLVKKLVQAGYDTINFAIKKIHKNGKEEFLFPDYKVSEFLAS